MKCGILYKSQSHSYFFLKEYQLEHKALFSTPEKVFDLSTILSHSLQILIHYGQLWLQLVLAVYIYCYEHCLCIMLFIYMQQHLCEHVVVNFYMWLHIGFVHLQTPGLSCLYILFIQRNIPWTFTFLVGIVSSSTLRTFRAGSVKKILKICI